MNLIRIFDSIHASHPTFNLSRRPGHFLDDRTSLNGFPGFGFMRVEITSVPIGIRQPFDWIKLPTNDRRIRRHGSLSFIRGFARRDVLKRISRNAAQQIPYLLECQEENIVPDSQHFTCFERYGMCDSCDTHEFRTDGFASAGGFGGKAQALIH